MNRKAIAAIVSLLTATADLTLAYTKSHGILHLDGGMALSYIANNNSDSRYGPRFLPNIGLTGSFLIQGPLSVSTGVVYEQKGWYANSENIYADNVHSEFNRLVKLHELAIPLQLCYTIPHGKVLQYSFSGGMSYGFLVNAEEKLHIDTYHGTRFLESETFSLNPRIGLLPDNSLAKSTNNGSEFYLFDTAIRAEARVTWLKRFSLRAFWEYNLYNIDATPGSLGSIHIGYIGLSMGLNLW